MPILCERVEQLERYFPLPSLRSSPWLPEALMILTDDELDRAGEFFQLAIIGNQSQATPAQWDALAVLARQEAQLKAQAIRTRRARSRCSYPVSMSKGTSGPLIESLR
jgi:hypothetical protein